MLAISISRLVTVEFLALSLITSSGGATCSSWCLQEDKVSSKVQIIELQIRTLFFIVLVEDEYLCSNVIEFRLLGERLKIFLFFFGRAIEIFFYHCASVFVF